MADNDLAKLILGMVVVVENDGQWIAECGDVESQNWDSS